VHFNQQRLEKPELQDFQRSSTGHLKTLSKFEDQDLALVSRDTEVVGMHGRRRLKRGNSIRANRTGTGWGGRNWMDQQRQFLQAYEYLCHIGEAKEWIEDIIQKSIPPIVQLEETLRDGVTLAEVAQALQPHRSFRIFRHERLQARHWDNIAIFRNFLTETELPDLFWFELVDLYDKKNIPKVIYCIHALSWLLYRKGVVDFRIGNLVGQLTFEDHELEATQKGLDKVGAMPNFSGMGATFGAEPEPEPEPVDSEEERINRELAENEEVIAELQAQIRGAMTRLRLGDTMQDLWDAENWVVTLQAKIRGDFAREIFEYKRDMRRSAIALQSAARGFLVRCRARYEQYYWREMEREIVLIQSLARGCTTRAELKRLNMRAERYEHDIRKLQAAMRGALIRDRFSNEVAATREAEDSVQWLQAAIRGALARKEVADQVGDLHEESMQIQKIQAAVRGLLQRRLHRTDRTSLRQQESLVTTLQAAARAMVARREHVETKEQLHLEAPQWEKLQSVARGHAARALFNGLRQDLQSNNDLYLALQTAARAYLVRKRVAAIHAALHEQEPYVVSFQSQSRGLLLRGTLKADRDALHRASSSITYLQSAIRGFAHRQKTEQLLNALYEHEDSVVMLQSISRAMLCNRRIGIMFMELEAHEEAMEQLQSLIRGSRVRVQFAEKKKFYHENMQKVVKIQSFIRARQQGEAYKTLTSGKNPPVGTVKNFVHLLNDSDFDFDEEIGMYNSLLRLAQY
jgi:Ras GTPase-activating-like protein IQGAP2/3